MHAAEPVGETQHTDSHNESGLLEWTLAAGMGTGCQNRRGLP